MPFLVTHTYTLPMGIQPWLEWAHITGYRIHINTGVRSRMVHSGTNYYTEGMTASE